MSRGGAVTPAGAGAVCRASAAGTSRATLARRFHDLVGQTPIGYLTSWRLTLAADVVTETDTPLEAVARQVGYGDAFALSAAFKRVRGISPSHYRQAARSARLGL